VRLIVVSGLSGSGKSIALQTLEDIGYYCVDNLPIDLLPAFVESMVAGGSRLSDRMAVGIDARNSQRNIEHFEQIIEALPSGDIALQILFLQATDETLIQRYSETRRRHPLSHGDLPLVEAIRGERKLLEPIVAMADLVVDTSRTNVHQLRRMIRTRLHETPKAALSILFESFGFKHGVPADADFVFDVRCLPNPYWEPSLRAHTGLERPVIEFLDQQDTVRTMLEDIGTFLDRWIPQFEAENRSYLTVAIGCTGGQHRSVYVAEALARRFDQNRSNVTARHRELG
jgi:UPF0042 nucleotide-binding protein